MSKIDDVLYKNSYLKRFGELKDKVPEISESFMNFEKEVFKAGQVSVKTKELIAIAVAHTTGCPYCIEAHVAKYKKLGGTMEEILESIMVASALKAGAAISHGVNAANAFDRY